MAVHDGPAARGLRVGSMEILVVGLVAFALAGTWLRAAVEKVDELVEFSRRNIQKSIALDAFAVQLRKR